MEVPTVVGGIPEVRIRDKASLIWRLASGPYLLCLFAFTSVIDLSCSISLNKDLSSVFIKFDFGL